MLFMIIERFKDRDPQLVGERFRRDGRMLTEGVVYHEGWVDSDGMRCFQLMEAPNAESLNEWIRRWEDLVDFEVVPVVTSREFWARSAPRHSRRLGRRCDDRGVFVALPAYGPIATPSGEENPVFGPHKDRAGATLPVACAPQMRISP
jgi:hypothetical protein